MSWATAQPEMSGDDLMVGRQQAVAVWERPFMEALCDALMDDTLYADVLEVGYGLGMSSAKLRGYPHRSYRLVELNEALADRAEIAGCNVIRGDWRTLDLEPADRVFLDPCPAGHDPSFVDTLLRLSRRLVRERGRVVLPGHKGEEKMANKYWKSVSMRKFPLPHKVCWIMKLERPHGD